MDYRQSTTIFATKNGIVALDSPVKLRLLEILKDGTKSFDELVEKSGKAKSTISVHLHDLEKLNLIEEKSSPNDKRKKYFVLNSLYLAYSETPMWNQYKQYLDYITISTLRGGSFKEYLFFTIRYGMEAYGVDPKPILKKLGWDIGTKIGEEFESYDYNNVLSELSFFWKNHDMGEMTVVNENKLTIIVLNCYHCGSMPNVGKTLCSMDEGIIEGVLSSRLNSNFNVREIECFGTGHDHCKFYIE